MPTDFRCILEYSGAVSSICARCSNKVCPSGAAVFPKSKMAPISRKRKRKIRRSGSDKLCRESMQTGTGRYF